MTTAAGYIGDVVEHVAVPNKGRAPLWWYGITAPDGTTSPWASAPVGSLYIMKKNETAQAVIFFKVDANGVDGDWGSLPVGRSFAGGPMGFLLLLTHR